MSGRQLTPHRQVKEYLQEQIRVRETALLNAFAYVGEACIKEARENGSYSDRSGNLRSSIGYVILRDGAVVFREDFVLNSSTPRIVKQKYKYKLKNGTIKESVRNVRIKGGDGQKGVEAGKKLLQELVTKYQKGFALIVVAGMKYAAYVEAMNYNVLTSAELLAQQLVPQILKRLGFRKV